MSHLKNPSDPERSGKSSELTLRLISAGVGLPLLGLVLYMGFWAISVVAIIVAAVVGSETRQMAIGGSASQGIRVSAMVSGAVVAGMGAFAAALGYLDIEVTVADRTAVAVGFIALIILVEMVVTSRFPLIDKIRRNLVLSYGAFAVMAVTMLPFVVGLDQGRELLAFVILVVFATDTGAYFIGKAFGKRKMAPNISPGKTWEGFAGGIATALIASWILSNLLSLDFTFTRSLVMGLSIAVIGVVGDLGESWIKRLSGVKDSGGIIPGHGGIMDRLDALAPNFVFVYFIERWLV